MNQIHQKPSQNKSSKSKDESSDHQLMRAVSHKRDRQAFEELIHKHSSSAFALSYRIIRNRELAEEAVQEGFLRAWLYASTWRPEGSVRGWLLKVIATAAIYTMRQDGRKSRSVSACSSLALDRVLLADDDLEKRETLAISRAAYRTLPVRDQRILALYFGAEMTQKEIGNTLKIPQRTVSRTLTNALEKLKSRLTERGLAGLAALAFTEHMQACLLSGVAQPGDLQQTLINQFRMDAGTHCVSVSSLERGQANARLLNQSGSWSRGGLLLTGTAGLMLATSLGFVMAYMFPKTELPEAITNSASLEMQKIESYKDDDLIGAWNFDRLGDTDELVPVVSNWNHVSRGGESDSGFMRMDPTQDFRLSLPVTREDLPVTLTYRFRVKDNLMLMNYPCWGGQKNTALIMFDNNVNKTNTMITKPSTPSPVWRHMKYEITVDGALKCKEFGIFFAGKPNGNLWLCFKGLDGLDNLEIRRLRKEKVTDTHRFKHMLDQVTPKDRNRGFAFVANKADVYPPGIVMFGGLLNPHAYLDRTFTFNGSEDLLLFRGGAKHWAYQQQGGFNNSPCIRTNPTQTFLNTSSDTTGLPLKVSYKVQLIHQKGEAEFFQHRLNGWTVGFSNNKTQRLYQGPYETASIKKSKWYLHEAYISDRFVEHRVNGKCVRLYSYEPRRRSFLVVLQVGEALLDDLRFEHLNPEDMPDFSRYQDAMDDPPGGSVPDVQLPSPDSKKTIKATEDF